MGEPGYLDIVCGLTRILAIGAAVLFGLGFISIIWLTFSERSHKKA